MTATRTDPPAPMPPWCANPLIGWLLTEAWDTADASPLLWSLVHRLNAAGMCLLRVRLTVRTLHPQVIGASFTWSRTTDEVEEFRPPHSILGTDAFLKSPYASLFEGAGAIRRRLDVPGLPLEYPVLEDLRAEGATDYVAMPIAFSDGQINALTLATDRPGGFTAVALNQVYEMLPVLARLESLSKTLGPPVVVSAAFVEACPGDWVSLGSQPLRGVGAPQEVFTFAEDVRSAA